MGFGQCSDWARIVVSHEARTTGFCKRRKKICMIHFIVAVKSLAWPAAIGKVWRVNKESCALFSSERCDDV